MKILSLYSGGGGIDIGFGKNKFKTVLSIENWDKACLTLKKIIFPKMLSAKTSEK